MLTVTKYVLMQVIVPSFFFTTHADPLKAQLIMIMEAVKVIRLLSQLKSTYVCTLQMFTGDLRGSHSSYIIQDVFSKLETTKIGKTTTN